MKIGPVLASGILLVALAIPMKQGPVAAAPGLAVSGISGSVSPGNTVTVAGNGFGTKPAGPPLKFDRFEDGAVGSVVGNGWNSGGHTGLAAHAPQYVTDFLRANSGRSVRCAFTSGNTSCNFALENFSTSTLYMDFWFRFKRNGTDYPGNYKMFRLYNTTYSAPNSYWGFLGNAVDSIFQTDVNGTPVTEPPYYSYWIGPQLSDFESAWRHVQVYFVMSSQPATGGSIQIWMDGQALMPPNATNSWNWRQSGATGTWSAILFGNYGYTTPSGYYTYWDDVYVDNTPARVEVGNASSYGSATQREIQEPINWTNTSISVRLNRGGFSSLSGLYLYVIDSTGNISQGYPLNSAGGAPPSAPAAPTGVRVSP